MKRNKIGWCDITVNPVTGCPNGCEYCYARSMNNRYKWIEDFSKPQFFPERLKGFRTSKPQIIFIDSMSDIGWWNEEWFKQVAKVMAENPQNVYLALTKYYRSINLLKALKTFTRSEVPLYIGATVTNNAQAQAVIDAGGADFISFEPLLERIKPELLEKLRCKWWIVGDLTKNGKPQRVTRPWWADEMVTIAADYLPVFMKDSMECAGCLKFKQEFPAEIIEKVGAR